MYSVLSAFLYELCLKYVKISSFNIDRNAFLTNTLVQLFGEDENNEGKPNIILE